MDGESPFNSATVHLAVNGRWMLAKGCIVDGCVCVCGEVPAVLKDSLCIYKCFRGYWFAIARAAHNETIVKNTHIA